MSKRSKIWMAAVLGVVAAFVVAVLVMHPSYQLNAVTDIVESLLVASGAASFMPLARRAKGRMRLFWSLIILWITLWCGYELFWVYFEVLVRREVPDLFLQPCVPVVRRIYHSMCLPLHFRFARGKSLL